MKVWKWKYNKGLEHFFHFECQRLGFWTLAIIVRIWQWVFLFWLWTYWTWTRSVPPAFGVFRAGFICVPTIKNQSLGAGCWLYVFRCFRCCQKKDDKDFNCASVWLLAILLNNRSGILVKGASTYLKNGTVRDYIRGSTSLLWLGEWN